jgi:pimeloyl-ACP methyl ester carboxylesterase
MQCDLGKLSVYYEVVGEGRPILMLHGTPVDHNQMMHEMEPIFQVRNGWKRIYPDIPGHGRTPPPDWITNSEGILKVVESFIDMVIPNRRFVIAGTSFGGYIARGLVHNRGSQIDGLFLNSPAIIQEESKRSLPPRQVVLEDAAVKEKAAKEAVGGFEEMAVQQNESVLNYLRTMKTKVEWSNYDDSFLRKVQDVSFSFDVDKIPAPFPAPTLFITGRQDSICGYRDAWQIIENYPRATFAVLDMAGHLAHAEQPEVWTALVNEWVNRVEDWAVMKHD